MGTSSYILAGTAEAEAKSFGSTAHGAGRVMSRHEALKRFRGERIRDDLAAKGIELRVVELEGRRRGGLRSLQGRGRGRPRFR